MEQEQSSKSEVTQVDELIDEQFSIAMKIWQLRQEQAMLKKTQEPEELKRARRELLLRDIERLKRDSNQISSRIRQIKVRG